MNIKSNIVAKVHFINNPVQNSSIKHVSNKMSDSTFNTKPKWG